MAKVDNPGIWEKIQKNVQETERLMGQKKYNQSMIKARQTLEYMVKLKCDQAGIVESSLDHMIHELYDGQWINHCGKTSSPSPLKTQSTNGFLRRNSSLSPRNSGPPSTRQASGSNAFTLEATCISCSWLKSQVVAARMSGRWR